MEVITDNHLDKCPRSCAHLDLDVETDEFRLLDTTFGTSVVRIDVDCAHRETCKYRRTDGD